MGFNQIPKKPEGGQALARLRVFHILRHGNNWKYLYKFDQYVQQLKIQFQKKYPNGHQFPKFKWQESFRDHYIRNQKSFDNHMQYIEYNPFKLMFTRIRLMRT